MPPQQFERLLDLANGSFGFRTHDFTVVSLKDGYRGPSG
ncbi:MAG: hypothetical protein RJB62_1015, partial [Pseudomonadota bacterium]